MLASRRRPSLLERASVSLLPLVLMGSVGCAPVFVGGHRDMRDPALLARAPVVERVVLRVASYNAWLLPFAARDLETRLQRMPGAIGLFTPDVLCLQEAWFDAQRDLLQADLAHGLPHVADGGGGLALSSRYPIAERRFHPFPDDSALSLYERFGGKGVLEVVIATPAGLLRVLVTHLAFDRSGDGGYERQLEELFARMAARPDLPTVLCGDLNLTATRDGRLTAGYERMLALGYVDAHAPARGEDGRYARRPRTRYGWPRRDGLGRGWDPDYLMARGATGGSELRVLRGRVALDDPETALSDHNLLLGDLLLQRVDAGAPPSER